MAEVIDLQQIDLLKVHVVPVVSAVDLMGLQGLLKQLLQGQKDSNDQLQRHAADIDALKAAQTEAPQQTGDGTSPADAATAALEGLQGQLAALDKRLSDLEAQQQQSPTEPSTGQHTMQDVGGASTAADTSNTATPAADLLLASAPTATSDQQPTGLSELKQQQGQLAQQITDMAAAQKGLQQQLSALQDGKADRGGVRDMLAEGLAGKADAAAVNQLKAQLGDKADRSELDALMNAMAAGSSSSGMDGEPSSSGAGSADAADGASTATAAGDAQQPESGHASSSTSSEQPAADGGAPRADVGGSRRSTREQGGAGDMAQQLSKLQLQLAVLQDRLNKKADSQAVADIADGLASTNSQVSDLSDALQALQQHVQAADGIPADPTSTADAWDPSTAQQLQEQLAALAARLAALEGAVPGLQSAVAAAQQARRVSGEQPASSKLVQILAAQLADLAGKVSRLSAQATNGTSGTSGPAQAVDPEDASSTPTAAGSDSGVGGLSVGSAGGFGAELAAELDGRVSDLEALVQDLSVLKADQVGLQELRSLLADTATQADTDQLRQRLTSQQSLLDRLARQISSLSSNSHNPSAGAGAGSNSRPQSAARSSRSHSSTGAMTPVSPEYSFFGGGAGAAGGQDGMHAGGAGLSTHQAHAAGAGQQQGGLGWGPGSDFTGLDGVDVGGTGGVLDQEGGAVLGALQAQLQSHQASLEQLAEALCLLATGQAAPAAAAAGAVGAAATAATAGRGGLGALQVCAESDAVDFAAGRSHGAGDGSVPETPNLRFAGARNSAGAAAAAGLGGAAGQGGAAAAGRPGTAIDNRGPPGSRLGAQNAAGAGGGSSSTGMGDGWGRGAGLQQPLAAGGAAMWWEPGPQVACLKRLLQTGQVGRKMDWFDPTLLQKMAQRLAAIDALLKNGAGAGAAGSGDLEVKLRRLATDVRQLKDRMGELLGGAAAGQQGGLRALGQATDGDHSMLSGKPLGGYRCMACDRPLTTLDSRPGPYLPSGQLPVSLASGAEMAAGGAAALGKLPPASTGSRRATAEAAYGSVQPSEPLVASSPDGSRRLAGPQNWYKEVHGLPAEQLPKGDVGPHLPPGGWRGAQSLKGEDGVLPLVRGGSTASTSGATPRTAGSDRGVSGGGAR